MGKQRETDGMVEWLEGGDRWIDGGGGEMIDKYREMAG